MSSTVWYCLPNYLPMPNWWHAKLSPGCSGPSSITTMLSQTGWREIPTQPAPPPERREGRNHDWPHLFARDVISMPDKWEFPWFASWDLGFHCVTLAYIDPHLAKEQILLMLREWYMHPNGQIPAYEWDFSGVNPPDPVPGGKSCIRD